MIGTHIFDYVHELDQSELSYHFMLNNQHQQCSNIVNLSLRFKSNLVRKNSQMKLTKWRVKKIRFYQSVQEQKKKRSLNL